MGQSKGSGYQQVPTLPPNIIQLLNQMAQQSQGLSQQAAQGYQDFLPGGKGGEAFRNQANQNFQQQTIPSILNAFGSGTKGGSSLNQALAQGGSNLNTDLSALLANAQLSASGGLANLAGNQQQIATQTPQFALQQRQPALWQQILQTGLNTAGQLGAGWASGGFGKPW